jgi:hypothetical protein
MKKHNNHFLLISIVSIFLSFFLSSTFLVSAAGPEHICKDICESGAGVSEGSYCDVDGPCCCPPLSCIGHICSSVCIAKMVFAILMMIAA